MQRSDTPVNSSNHYVGKIKRIACYEGGFGEIVQAEIEQLGLHQARQNQAEYGALASAEVHVSSIEHP